MPALAPRTMELTADQLADYDRDGYLIVRGLLGPEEVAEIRDFFQDMADRGEPTPGWMPGKAEGNANEPLRRYPRAMQPHRWNEMSRRYLLDPRIGDVLRQLLDEEPIAAQTMFYFKPPGSKGQAFHQDNFYLAVQPNTCIAAWVAIDPSYPENGGLHVCPGTHKMDIVCPEEADAGESFSPVLVRPPAGVTPVPAILDPGDVLFFNGSVIHGSQPNTSGDQWRRSFICHYMPASGKQISEYYFPLLDFHGREVHRETSLSGGPCGG